MLLQSIIVCVANFLSYFQADSYFTTCLAKLFFLFSPLIGTLSKVQPPDKIFTIHLALADNFSSQDSPYWQLNLVFRRDQPTDHARCLQM